MQRTATACYDADFALWAEEQAAALREGRIADVDIANVSEEIESLARSDRRRLRNRLATLMMHLLKLDYQSARVTPSWRRTVAQQALKIELLLCESPSLRPELPDVITTAYQLARRQAAIETDLPLARFADAPTTQFSAALAAALDGDAGVTRR